MPNRCTGMIALVRGVTRGPALATSIWKVSDLTSTNTGVAPTITTEVAEAMKVLSGTITSSPGPISSAIRPSARASVPLGANTPYSTPINSLSLADSSAERGPSVIQFSRTTWATASASSSPTQGIICGTVRGVSATRILRQKRKRADMVAVWRPSAKGEEKWGRPGPPRSGLLAVGGVRPNAEICNPRPILRHAAFGGCSG